MSRRVAQVLERVPPALKRRRGGLGWLLRRDLDVLADLFGTDKGPADHGFTPWYAAHLGPLRREARSILEIGIGGYQHREQGGESLRMWRAYFRHARIVGVDIFEKDLPDAARIVTLTGDQSDSAFLRELVARFAPFDVVVDDGSHVGSDQRASFEGLFDAVRPGGFYVIEDLETSYWQNWDGGPPGAPGTGVALVKELVDDTNVGPRPVAAVHAYPGIVFIERAGEPAVAPAPVPRPTAGPRPPLR